MNAHSLAVLGNGIPWVLGISLLIVLFSGNDRLDRLDAILVGLALLFAAVPQTASLLVVMNPHPVVDGEQDTTVSLLLLVQIAAFSLSHLLLAVRHGRTPTADRTRTVAPSFRIRTLVAGSVLVFIGALMVFAAHRHVLHLLMLPLLAGGVSLWVAGDAASVDRFPSTNTLLILLGVGFWFLHELISSAYYISGSEYHTAALVDMLCRFSSAFLYQPSLIMLSLSVYRFGDNPH